ncbi:MAG: glycosyltransferase family 2 protein [bacterium]|nr:glycosyltransferase family 2 protein [bacterium]
MALGNKRIAVLIPAYNEGSQIRRVLDSVPDYVDRIVVIDDASQDNTASEVEHSAEDDDRIELIRLSENSGVGGALNVGYNWARDNGMDIAVSVDGDGQMDPDEMANLVDPIVKDQADYTKGNRLLDPVGWRQIPRIRLFGNAILSLLTKMASGYWSVSDSQSGYSAAGRVALERINWDSMYKRYGRPNDVLVLANVAECRVADVPITPIYGVGERSSMNIAKVTFAIAALLLRRFWWRLFHKYLLRDFHPLLFFYLLAMATFFSSVALAIRLVYYWIANGSVPQLTALALVFFTITTLNSLFFAFWMDMQANAHLAVRVPAQPTSASARHEGETA